MAKSEKKSGRHEILGIFFLALGLFFSLSIVSYDPADPALNVTSTVRQINNLGGVVGAYTADILFNIFGVSAYFMCLVLFIISFMQFLGRSLALNWKEAVSYTISIIAVASIIHIKFGTIHLSGQPLGAGGFLGGLAGEVLKRWLGTAGAYIVSTTLAVLSLLYSTHLSIITIAGLIKKLTIIFAKWLGAFAIIHFERSKKWIVKNAKRLTSRGKARVKISAKAADRPAQASATALAAPAPSSPPPAQSPAETGPKIFERADSKPTKVRDSQLELARMSRNYLFPPISLLDSPEQKVNVIDEESLKKNAILLEKKLKDYGVEGHVTEIHPGPVITMYEFEPAPGVKVGKIVNLEDDLSVTMGGRSVRIVPHLPGKAAIGIEIPNVERELVWLKEIISDPKFRRSTSRLTFALGKDTEGHSVVTDLGKMPHLLVAGATGSGKSVAINTMITSILYKSTPEEVRLILIDPKMLELPIYNGIPHLLLPVVTRPRRAVLALQWAMHEMDRRYRLLADAGTRNIAGYNEKLEKGLLKVVSLEEEEAVCHTGKLPYIVIIIDELADLIMMAPREIEESITRLAQMARAAGIHLVLATQRPSVDVITGLIKANFPARMAFKVSSQHDSRTIIDTGGADKLLGMGDMLFMPPHASDIMRLHGAYITEAEITRIVSHTKEQGQPIYDESITAERGEAGDGGVTEEGEYDELYDAAVKLVAETRQASISMIQRRFRIGYNRAARLVEKMEAEGVVGPADGARPREVLVNNLPRE